MKIPKDKRNKLIGVAAGTIAVVCALWYFLIGSQSAYLAEANKQISTAEDNEQRIQTAIKLADKIQAELDEAKGRLAKAEEQMASGDLYSWMYSLIKGFKAGYRVEIPQFSAVETSECSLVPKFPFKQAKMSIMGSGYFHEIGKFIADFENQHPYIRFQNLSLSPSTGGQSAGDREKLNFRVEVISLLKNPTQTK